MRKAERIVIYSALIVMGAVNMVLALSQSGQQAFAEASAWLAELGPAEAIKLVEGDKEIVVRPKSGRIAWGDGDFKQSYTVGFIDISRALNPLMESEAMKEERDALTKELEAKEAEYKEKLEGYGKDLQGMDRESPEGQAKLEEAQAYYKEYMDWGQEAMQRRNELDVQHLQKAYRELTSAVDVVSDKLGVDIVLRFIPTEKDFKATDAEQALTEIRLRTAVKYPEKLDMTSEVLEELSLQDADEG